MPQAVPGLAALQLAPSLWSCWGGEATGVSYPCAAGQWEGGRLQMTQPPPRQPLLRLGDSSLNRSSGMRQPVRSPVLLAEPAEGSQLSSSPGSPWVLLVKSHVESSAWGRGMRCALLACLHLPTSTQEEEFPGTEAACCNC